MGHDRRTVIVTGFGALIFTAVIGFTLTRQLTLDAPIYVSPSPAATLVQPATTIAVRYNGRVQASRVRPVLFTVVGSITGRHDGRAVLSDDQMTIIFMPSVPFTASESVSVAFDGGPLGAFGQQFGHYATAFTISPKLHQGVVLAPGSPPQAVTQTVPTAHYVTAAGTLPLITVTNHISPVMDQDVFLNTSSASNDQYLLILDPAGQLVYYKPLPPARAYTDFTEQPNGLLTYFDGATTSDLGQNVFHVLNSSYTEVDEYQAGNGYSADSHELRILPDGHALLTVYDEEPVDLSAIGGKPGATVSDLVIQELDLAKNVVFQWRASEHIPYTDTFDRLGGDTADPYHGNSIEPLPDGNLLISFRHLSQLVKVSRQTGDVIWRMGGRHGDFTFTNDPGFSYQHDARQLPNGHITVFDNGNQHDLKVSRAVEYAVDESNNTVTRVWEYTHTPGIFGSYMGDVEQLPNGDVFVGWGGPSPIASEVTRDGQLVQDMEVGTSNDVVYRWYKLPWTGSPDTTPTLVAQADGNKMALYFSWNGATDVSAYEIDSGDTADNLIPILTQEKQGFETSVLLNADQSNHCYYRVLALDKTETPMRYSNTVSAGSSGCI